MEGKRIMTNSNYYHKSTLENNISKKHLLIFSSLLFSILLFAPLTPDADATHKITNDLVGDVTITYDLIPAETNQIFYRDSTNSDPQPTAQEIGETIQLDASTIKAGFVTISITEEDSNLNPSAMDVILSSATSTTSGLDETPVTLKETGNDTGLFTGILLVAPGGGDGVLPLGLGDEITVLYEPQHDPSEKDDAGNIIGLGVGRLSAEIRGVSGPGTVDISHTTSIEGPCKFVTATHPVGIKFSPGITADNMTVTISYANKAEGSPLPDELDMGYRFDKSSTWRTMDFETPLLVNTAAKTISATIEPVERRTIFGKLVSNFEGQYALGRVLADCPGGGGGGIARAGFVVNTLAGAGSLVGLFSGGSGGGAVPTFGDASVLVLGNPSDGFGGVISEDGNSLDSTKIVKTGDTVAFRFPLHENQGINNLERFILHYNFEGENYDASTIDSQILYERGNKLTIVDPHEKIESAEVKISEVDPWNLLVIANIVFKNPFNTSILVESWDLDRNSGKKLYADSLVVEPSILLADEQKILNEPSSILTSEEAIEETELTEIPVWVKSNALWWKQKQIDDSDFMAGIQYLIKKSLIEIDENDLSNSQTSKEIPVWISDVAGLWADDSISDEEFVNAMQWLISNGILEVKQ